MRELPPLHDPIRYRAGDFLALWRCDEASGDLVDVTGSYTASITSGTVNAAGGLFSSPEGTTGGRAFSAAYATATGDAAARTVLLGEWTISAWVKLSATGASQYFLVYSGTNIVASIGCSPSGVPYAYWRNTASSLDVTVSAPSSSAFSVGTAYHLGVVKEADPSNAGKYRVRLYVNGRRVTTTSNLTNTDSGSTTPKFTIGATGSGTLTTSGTLDDLAILKFAASDELVRDIYTRGALTYDAATIADAESKRTFSRVSIETTYGDPSTRVDLTALYGQDFVRSIEWSDDIDDQGASARVRLAREVYALSLSPEVGSVINTDAGGALLKLNRRVLIETATVPRDTLPTAALPWALRFDGFISGVDWGGDDITLDLFDRMAPLQDVWIEPNRTPTPPEDRSYGSNTSTLSVESQMQLVIDDNEPATVGYVGRKPTLYVPTSPGYGLNEASTPSTMSVAAKLEEWVGQFGWLCRYKWDDYRKEFRLTLFEPDRTKTWASGDPIIKPAQVLSLSKIEVRRDDIRNFVEVEYPDSTITDTATNEWVMRTKTAQNATSITKYGRRYCRIGLGSMSEINTGAQAQKLADAVVSDLAEPKADLSIETHYLPHIEVGDVVKLEADASKQYFDADQAFSVVSVSHSIADDETTSRFALRAANPVGRRLHWWDLIQVSGRVPGKGVRPPGVPLDFALDAALEGVRVKWRYPVLPGNRRYLETEIHRSTTSGFTPSTSTLLGTVRGMSSAVFPASTTTTHYYKIVHRDDGGGRSAASSQLSSIGGRIGVDTVPAAWRSAVYVKQTAPQTINLATPVDTKITDMTDVQVDNNSDWSGGALQRFYAPVKGVYSVSAAVGMTRTTGTDIRLALYKVGTGVIKTTPVYISIAATNQYEARAMWFVELAASDAIFTVITADATKPINITTIEELTFISASLLFAIP